MVTRSRVKKAESTANVDPSLIDDRPTRPKSLVFISHDSRDADVAELFANLLSDVSAGTLKSFRSSDKKGGAGIEFGAEWYGAIMSQIADATDVVALLTPNSLDRPWILYEAGVAKGRLETTVFGVALGVSLERVSTGPFGQFQNCGDDEDSLTKLVMQLLSRNPDASPREAAVRMQVRLFKDKFTEVLKARGQAAASEMPKPEEQTAKLFEEIKAMVREMPERMELGRHAIGRKVERRPNRNYQMMVNELAFNPRLESGHLGFGLGWLVIISAFKDEFPWVYEAGLDLYRTSQMRGNLVDRKIKSFRLLVDVTMQMSFSSSGPMTDAETYHYLRIAADAIEHYLHIARESRQRLAPHAAPVQVEP